MYIDLFNTLTYDHSLNIWTYSHSFNTCIHNHSFICRYVYSFHIHTYLHSQNRVFNDLRSHNCIFSIPLNIHIQYIKHDIYKNIERSVGRPLVVSISGLHYISRLYRPFWQALSLSSHFALSLLPLLWYIPTQHD